MPLQIHRSATTPLRPPAPLESPDGFLNLLASGTSTTFTFNKDNHTSPFTGPSAPPCTMEEVDHISWWLGDQDVPYGRGEVEAARQKRGRD